MVIYRKTLQQLFLFLLLSGTILNVCIGQNTGKKFSYQYELVKMDSTYAEPVDLTMSTYIENLRSQMGEKLNVIIGHASMDMPRYKPQSPLSNFLVDQLFIFGNQYFKQNNIQDSIDLSLINFGGIRASLNAGKITIENMYQIAPFDNYAVILYVKGSELRKMYKKFSEKENGALSHSQTIFQNGRIVSYTINELPIDDQKTYRLITLDFLQHGGDGFLDGVVYEKVIYTGVLIRDVYTERITQLTGEGKKIEAKQDQRVIIKPTP